MMGSLLLWLSLLSAPVLVRAQEDVNDPVDLRAGGGNGSYTPVPMTGDKTLRDEESERKLAALVRQALTESPLIDG
jgi:hypothetical protein